MMNAKLYIELNLRRYLQLSNGYFSFEKPPRCFRVIWAVNNG